MFKDSYPVQWTGRQAVVALPEHIDISNASQIREQLLSVVNRGAAPLIVDMTATVSCDQAGADAVVRAYQRAVASGTQLRLVVTAEIVVRVLSLNGLDRLVSIYPSLAAAAAAGAPATLAPAVPGPAGDRAARERPQQQAAGAENGPGATAIAPSVLWTLVDALADGVALTDSDGMLALANRRLEDMFGYGHGELTGQPVESLIPADLRAVHRSFRAGYTQAPTARPMGERARLVGLRKDGATFPVEISLSPVPTATGHFTLAVVRSFTESQRHKDLADLARAAVAEQAHRGQELLDRVVSSLFQVGLSLQAAMDLPSDLARERIAAALQRLDETIHEIRDSAFASGGHAAPSRPAPPADAR